MIGWYEAHPVKSVVLCLSTLILVVVAVNALLDLLGFLGF